MADFLISLAHFCENHGPTPILCTQVTNDDCQLCDSTSTKRHHDKSISTARKRDSGLTFKATGLSQLRENSDSSLSSSPVSSPAGSPTNSAPFPEHWSNSPHRSRRGSITGIRPTTLPSVIAPDACANCWLALPKKLNEKLGNSQAPSLRTREAFAASPADIALDSSPIEEESTIRRSNGQSIPVRSAAAPPALNTFQVSSLPSSTASPPSPSSPISTRTISTPASSLSSLPPLPHAHTRTYLTQHSPPSQSTYAALRNSCIRTLTNEYLPSASSGPLIFGDAQSGYTIAYVFRVRDPNNRGGSRHPYALLCLGGKDQTRVMRAMPTITRVFQRIAKSIEGLVDCAAPESPDPEKVTFDSAQPFLLRRREYETRPKGLDELVGREDFFLEIHGIFAKLLSVLGKLYGSASTNVHEG